VMGAPTAQDPEDSRIPALGTAAAA
jgi:hypothetical protein